MTVIAIFSAWPFITSILCMVVGACCGSFAALIIDRLPQGRSIIYPRSFCQRCQTPIRAWHNIPIVSWLWLRGACAYCQSKIGLRPWFIEILFALALPALFLKFGISIALIERFAFLFILVCLAYIDLDTLYLPYSLLAALFITAAMSNLVYFFEPLAFVPPSRLVGLLELLVFSPPPIFSLPNRIYGAVIGFLGLSLINLGATMMLRLTKRLSPSQWAMGWGDPLLLMALGLFVGLSHMVVLVFLGSAMGSVIGIIDRLLQPKVLADDDVPDGALPFGPFLALAAIYVYIC